MITLNFKNYQLNHLNYKLTGSMVERRFIQVPFYRCRKTINSTKHIQDTQKHIIKELNNLSTSVETINIIWIPTFYLFTDKLQFLLTDVKNLRETIFGRRYKTYKDMIDHLFKEYLIWRLKSKKFTKSTLYQFFIDHNSYKLMTTKQKNLLKTNLLILNPFIKFGLTCEPLLEMLKVDPERVVIMPETDIELIQALKN